jgi:hypothetical protein
MTGDERERTIRVIIFLQSWQLNSWELIKALKKIIECENKRV